MPKQKKKTFLRSTGLIHALAMTVALTACNLPVNSGAAATSSPEKTSAVSPAPLSSPISGTGTATPVPSATVPVELSSLKDTTVRIIHPWSGETSAEFGRLVREFNEENIWKIKVEEVAGGSVGESSRTYVGNLESSERIDMIAISPEYLAEWNAAGDILDLSTYIENPEWGFPEKEKSTYFAQVMKPAADKKLTGIPAQVNLQFLVYNRTWAKELGFTDIPQTRADFTRQVCEAARTHNQDNTKENDGTGGWIINSSSPTLLAWINAFGGSKAWDSGTNVKLNQDETGEAFTFLRELTEKGCAWNSRVASPFNYFATRDALVFSASLPDAMELEQTLSFTNNSDEWVILGYPGKDNPAPALISGISYGITRTRPANELASWLFIRWLSLPKNQARLAEASGMLPPTSAAVDLMTGFAEKHTWWTEAAKMLPDALTQPTSSDWRQVRPVLEDSFWQMLQPTPLPVPTLLEQMDETIKTIPTAE